MTEERFAELTVKIWRAYQEMQVHKTNKGFAELKLWWSAFTNLRRAESEFLNELVA